MNDTKIKQDSMIHIGANIRRVRLNRKIGQTKLVTMLHLAGLDMTRESLVKIERGIQHVSASQLFAIKNALETTYDELLKPRD